MCIVKIQHDGILFLEGTIYLNASVGTHHGTVGTPDAIGGTIGVCKVVTTVVNLLALERQHIFRTCHHAEIASLATVSVDYHCSKYFCHIGVSYISNV